MQVSTLTYKANVYVDERGHVEFDLPAELPRNQQVDILYIVRPKTEPTASATAMLTREDADQEMTEEEADAILAEPWTFEAKTAGEIAASGVIGAWADKGITDSVAFLEEQRRKRREQLS